MSLTSEVCRNLNRVIGTWNCNHGVLLLLLLLQILCDVRLILGLILLLLLTRCRLLSTLLLLCNILLLTLIISLRCLLLRGLCRSERNLNVRSGNCERRLTTTNCTFCLCAPMNEFVCEFVSFGFKG